MGANFLQDAIKRVREGQGAEVDGGFSFRSKVDQWSTQRNRDVRPGQTLDQIRPTTAVLFIPAEKDELTQGPGGAIEAAKFLSDRGVPSQAIVLPGLTHFQAYSNAGFEVGSNLAADWFIKYLAAARPVYEQTAAVPAPPPSMRHIGGSGSAATRDVEFFSEGVRIYGRLYVPAGFSTARRTAAVIVPPDQGQTAATVAFSAEEIVKRGLVALAIDYRGFGKSGAFIYLAGPLRWDDRLRFSQHTAAVRLRRKRLLPEAQVVDIRNAITFLQGEPGVDPDRIGVAGEGLAGAHAIALAVNDARVKAAVTLKAMPYGKGQERVAFAPTARQQAVMVKLARTAVPGDEAAANALNADEFALAVAQYRPFQYADQIAKGTAVLQLDSNGPSDVGAAADFLAQSLKVP
jgi:dienelactone hydrolase